MSTDAVALAKKVYEAAWHYQNEDNVLKILEKIFDTSDFLTAPVDWTPFTDSYPECHRYVLLWDPKTSIMSARIWDNDNRTYGMLWRYAPKPPSSESEHVKYLRAVRESSLNRSDNAVSVLDRAIDIVIRYENQEKK